jgi:hypothetical protein
MMILKKLYFLYVSEGVRNPEYFWEPFFLFLSEPESRAFLFPSSCAQQTQKKKKKYQQTEQP